MFVKAVHRPRWPLAVGAASVLLLAAGPASASPPAHGPRGVSVVVCGRDGRTEVLVRVGGAVLLPIGRVTVRVGGPCEPRPGSPSPTTAPPGSPPASPPPTEPPTTSPPPPPPATTPAPPARTGRTPRAAGYAPGPDRGKPHVRPSAGPGPRSTPGAHVSPSATDTFALPQPGGEPYPHGTGGGAARWWLLTVAVVLLPAVLAAVPYRTSRRRR